MEMLPSEGGTEHSPPEDGFVGASNGDQVRAVLLTPEQWEEMKRTGELAGTKG